MGLEKIDRSEQIEIRSLNIPSLAAAGAISHGPSLFSLGQKINKMLSAC